MGSSATDQAPRRRGERMASELARSIRASYADPAVAGMALFGAFVQVHLATGRSVALPNDTVRESAPYQHGERLAAELLRLADATSQTPENRSALITAVEDRLDIATRLLRDESPWPADTPVRAPFDPN